MKYAKQLDLGELEVKVDKSFERITSRMKRKGLGHLIKDRWQHRANKIQVSIEKRLRSSAGRAIWNTSLDYYKIKLHPELPLNNGKKHKSLQGTIDHEVIHILTLLGDSNKNFQKVCDTLNIEKFHFNDFSTYEENKYKLYCKGCGKLLAKRKRKSKTVKYPNKFVSSCCGEHLRVEEI